MHARHGRFDLQYKHMSPSSYISLQAQLYTGPRPCGKLWSPCIFLWVSLPAKFYCFGISPFTSFCILHYQLQFRDYGGSLAHRLQARFLLYAAGMYISRFAEEGSRTFFLLTYHSKFESGKDLLLHNVVSVHNSHDISLSTPLSRLWGKPCTSSPTSLSPICSWNVHFSFAELRCLYIFPKRHYPFPACRETTLTPASYSSPFSGTMLQSERQVVTNPAVGHGA